MTDKNVTSFVLSTVSESTDIQFLEAVRDAINARLLTVKDGRTPESFFVNLPAIRQATAKVDNFKAGDRVEFGRVNGKKMFGFVTKRNVKTVAVTGDDGRKWRVGPSLIKKVA